MPETIEVLSGQSAKNVYELNRARPISIGNTDGCEILVQDPLCVKPTKSHIHFRDDGWELKVISGGPWLVDSQIVSESSRVKANSLIQMSRFGPDLRFSRGSKSKFTGKPIANREKSAVANGASQATTSNQNSTSNNSSWILPTTILGSLAVLAALAFLVFKSLDPDEVGSKEPAPGPAPVVADNNDGEDSDTHEHQKIKPIESSVTDQPEKALVYLCIKDKDGMQELMFSNGVAVGRNKIACPANIAGNIDNVSKYLVYSPQSEQTHRIRSIKLHPRFSLEDQNLGYNMAIIVLDGVLPHYIETGKLEIGNRVPGSEFTALSGIRGFWHFLPRVPKLLPPQKIEMKTFTTEHNDSASKAWSFESIANIDKECFDGAPVLDKSNKVVGLFSQLGDDNRKKHGFDGIVSSIQTIDELLKNENSNE